MPGWSAAPANFPFAPLLVSSLKRHCLDPWQRMPLGSVRLGCGRCSFRRFPLVFVGARHGQFTDKRKKTFDSWDVMTDRLIVDHSDSKIFVRFLSGIWCIQLPTMTEQPNEEALKCLEFGVTLPLWRVLAGTLNQRVRSSSLRRPTKFPLDSLKRRLREALNPRGFVQILYCLE